MVRKRTKKEGKVKNATPTQLDGIKFRSKLEAYTYTKLKEAKIPIEYEKHRYMLLPSFIFENKTIRAITYLPDFVGNKFIIECKGYPNDSWALREKLFRYYLVNNLPDYKFYIVHNQKEVDQLIKELKDGR